MLMKLLRQFVSLLISNILLILLISSVVLDIWLTPKAAAEPKSGLYWEVSTTGPAYVRRLRDTSNGVVCYVAHGDNSYHTTAISCVKP